MLEYEIHTVRFNGFKLPTLKLKYPAAYPDGRQNPTRFLMPSTMY